MSAEAQSRPLSTATPQRSALFARLAPLAWTGLIAGLLVAGPETGSHPQITVPEIIVGVAVLGAAAAAPWARIMATRAASVLPVAAILLVLPVEFLPRWDMHYGIVLVLPVLWAAAYERRRTVLTSLGCVALACAALPIAMWSLPPTLVFDIVSVGIATLAALTAHSAVSRARLGERALTIAYTDALTRLPNRLGWDDTLTRMLKAMPRHLPLSVVVLDLDGFQDFNNDCGHAAGDRLLADVAEAWRQGLRPTDVLARFGSDEFALALPRTALADALNITERLQHITPNGHRAVAGAAEWNGTEASEELMARALAALEDAERATPATLSKVAASSGPSRPPWERVIQNLIAQEAIESVYQPIVRLSDRTVVGYEALARPAGAAEGTAVSGMFVAARKCGLANELEMLALKAAVEGSRALPELTDLFVNVGAGSLRDPEATARLLQGLLADAGRSADTVVLEISEAVTRVGRFTDALAILRHAGFRLALDDAGEGNSTIESLAVVRPEFVKLGRSLVVDRASPGAAATIDALVQFSRLTTGHVIAEGIEHDDGCSELLTRGVEYGQGYALGRPARMQIEANTSRAAA